MILVAMQPTYLPWIGYFDLLDQADVFVLLDDVQFSRRSWQQRNRIKTPRGLEFLTVPVKQRSGQLIKQAEISDIRFVDKHLRTIERHYNRAPFFSEFSQGLRDEYRFEKHRGNVASLNEGLIRWLAASIGIGSPIVRSSDSPAHGKRSNYLVSLCVEFGASCYLSPIGAASYIMEELPLFVDAGIDVQFQHYEHPTYEQLYPPFEPFSSAVDLLFNEAPRALSIIKQGREPSYSPKDLETQTSSNG